MWSGEFALFEAPQIIVILASTNIESKQIAEKCKSFLVFYKFRNEFYSDSYTNWKTHFILFFQYRAMTDGRAEKVAEASGASSTTFI